MSGFALASFAACVGDRFDLIDAPGAAWTLASAEGYGTVADPATHHAFSLSFRGAPDRIVAQQMVRLAHPALGEQAIFVTPIAQDAEGVTYEAVFN